MILHCTYEELSALSAGSERVLAESGSGVSVVAAPPEVIADVESLTARLTGDISVTTLAEQQSIARAINFVVAELKQRMDAAILDMHPADEYAVGGYFDYAHALSVQDRVVRVGTEMAAMIELMTGHAPTAESARTFTIPD